jgi:hypothetical protein
VYTGCVSESGNFATLFFLVRRHWAGCHFHYFAANKNLNSFIYIYTLCSYVLKLNKWKYRIFWPIACALSIQKRSEIVKNEHARYTLERFLTDNARVICTKKGIGKYGIMY